MASHRDASVDIDAAQVTRSVMLSQSLFIAGHSLTTGGFLAYFAAELGAAGFAMALLLAIPETVGVAGFLARGAVLRTGRRKRVWASAFLAARLVSLIIPLLAFPRLRPDGVDPLWLLCAVLAVAQAAQAVSYVAYLSWLSDLVPHTRWGRFFAWRNIAELAVLLVVPTAAGYLRDDWKVRSAGNPEFALLAYAAAFLLGNLLMLASMLPLTRLPDVAVRSVTATIPVRTVLTASWQNRSLRLLLIHNWWLALANGLTQAAFFSYTTGPLALKLGTFYLLQSVMRAGSIPVSWWAGRVGDRRGHKPPLIWGAVAASMAMPFWLLAAPGRWGWLFGAYLLWSAFAAVNISGRNLLLELSPRSDNTAQLTLFAQIGGLLAGLSGLAGGLWLDALREAKLAMAVKLPFASALTSPGDVYIIESWQLLFLVSWLGRLTAVLWLIPIQEPGKGTGTSPGSTPIC